MNIELSDEQFRAAATKAVEESITRAMVDYRTENALREAIASVIGESNWAEMVARAIKDIDDERIMRELSEHISTMLAAGMKRVLKLAMAEVCVSLNDRGYFTTEERAKRLKREVEILERALNGDGEEDS